MQFKNYLYNLSNSPFTWIFLFSLLISPLALSYILHYVDELHYTDAAIRMLHNHDYFTPKQANGESRFLKPILSYWLIASSYKIFGISQFSSRLPFLICGVILLWITFKTSLKLTKNKEISIISVLITASNPLVIISSSRSIPDIPQALFLSIGMLGIAGILTSDSPNKKDLWLFYLGFSFAFATKGIPSAIFMLISILFLILNPWKRIKLFSLINWAAIAVALFIALWWYILMYIRHGNVFFISFFNDQVGGRISEDHFRILKNLLFSAITPIAYFIFWIAAIFGNRLKNDWFSTNKPNSTQLFAILSFYWLAFIFLSSIFTVKFYDRYFLPVFPMISIIIASVLYSIKKATNRYYKSQNSTLALFGIILSAFAILVAIRLGNTAFAFASLFTFIIFSIIYYTGRNNASIEFQFKHSAFLLLLLIFTTTILISNLASPDQGSQIAKYLIDHKINKKEITFYGEKKVAAKIRVAFKGETIINCIDPNDSPIPINTDLLIYKENKQPSIVFSEYRIQNISIEWKSFPLLSFILIENPQSPEKNHRISYKIAIKTHKEQKH